MISIISSYKPKGSQAKAKTFKASFDPKTGKVTYRRKIYNSLSAAGEQVALDGGFDTARNTKRPKISGWDFWNYVEKNGEWTCLNDKYDRSKMKPISKPAAQRKSAAKPAQRKSAAKPAEVTPIRPDTMNVIEAIEVIISNPEALAMLDLIRKKLA